MRIKLYFAIAFALTLMVMMSSTVSAATITVDDSGGEDHTTIQAAINAANDSDTILVYSGTYTENVDVNKSLIIISQSGNPDDTNVQASNSNNHVFNVTRDNVTISGFNVTGATVVNKAGIFLDEVQNNTISDNKLSNNYFGIYLLASSNNTLNNNTASDNDRGIRVISSSNNTLNNNTANSNNFGGIWLEDSSNNNTLTNNTASDNTWRGIYILESSNNLLSNNTANSNNGNGILLHQSSNSNTLTNNTANSNYWHGIYLLYSSNNELSNNTASNNDNGIFLFSSSNNELSNNTASNNDDGIFLFSSSNNELSNNTASNNDNGILLYYASDNTLFGNTVCNNTVYGIHLKYSNYDNTIYNNYFNNTDNAGFVGTNTGNIWNITKTAGTNIVGGPFLGGNYWSDYDGIDANGDGIGDSLYTINGDIDYLPLCLIPIKETENLKEYLNGLGEEYADASTKEALNTKLDNVLDKLDKGDNDKAIKKLEDFIKFVGIMERQDRLGDEQAAYLISEAKRIIDLIQNSEG